MKILGINAFHADSAACIIIDGKIICAIEEERLTRVKHWAGFPESSISACLKIANMKIDELDYIAVNRDPNTHIFKKITFAITKKPSLKNVISRIKSRKIDTDISKMIAERFGVNKNIIEKKIYNVEHHVAHLASAYYPSGYEDAVLLSIDGFGDFVSTMWGTVEKNKIKIDDYITFPHSLGLFYQALTQYLGFFNYGDEYKIMGMAGYGNPSFQNEMDQILNIQENGKFELNNKYFLHQSEGVSMEFDDGYPKIGRVFSDEMINLLGKTREDDEKINNKHKDIASSVQLQFEKALFNILDYLGKKYPNKKQLCMAGGCAQNSLANGKITNISTFDEVWVQPAAGDAGGALGAAIIAQIDNFNSSTFSMQSASLGLSYDNDEIAKILNEDSRLNQFSLKYFQEDDELENEVVKQIINGNVIGFFHGSFEWGPRALGNRSIIVDPRIKNMKELLNQKIKKRESFRPFAPSIMEDQVSEWFENNQKVPFMTHVYKIKSDRRSQIPAVTHVDGTGRLQSVDPFSNQRYYNIISKFFDKTGVPMILNTSFNENEPIVNSPLEAINCFLRTNMDTLVLENHIIAR